MTEATQVDAAVRRNLGPLGRWKRVTHPEPGWPDWAWTMRGKSGWVEDKLIPPSRRCPPKFTLDQLVWAEDEARAGGSWHLLGLEPQSRTWFLLTVGQAREWFDGGELTALVIARGVFPTKEIALTLAPMMVSRAPIVGSTT